MIITEDQAMEYITAITLGMKKKIEIFDNNVSDNDIFNVSLDERLLFASLEIVLVKARSNALFERDKKNDTGNTKG